MTKQIKIEELIPFMKEGWVAMDKDNTWCFYSEEPIRLSNGWTRGIFNFKNLSEIFNIAPAEDWTKSLIRIKGEGRIDNGV